MKRQKHPIDAARDAQLDLIQKIADRAVSEYALHNIRVNRLDVLMDITAVHFGGCKLRLDDMLAADEFNFIHDITGINRNLDRDSGTLANCFRPRFSERVQS